LQCFQRHWGCGPTVQPLADDYYCIAFNEAASVQPPAARHPVYPYLALVIDGEQLVSHDANVPITSPHILYATVLFFHRVVVACYPDSLSSHHPATTGTCE
jgi:hypothetical protein